MWIVVGMASSQKMADAMQKCLESEGVLVKLRNVSAKAKSSTDTFEILVLQSEADSAREILVDNGY